MTFHGGAAPACGVARNATSSSRDGPSPPSAAVAGPTDAGPAAARGPSSSSARRLVVVESPAKAVKVQKFLGDDYVVLASYGHVRDLVGKSGSVNPEEDFAMRWAESGKGDAMKGIVRAAKDAEVIFLATDPDREGEAIAWHIAELLKEKGLVGAASRGHLEVPTPGGSGDSSFKVPHVRRVTFTEVTKAAVLEAFEAPRDLDAALVEAYLARRALDYLFGFNLSGVLWRKLPSTERLSAGRVQSAALRLVCERELEVERHVEEEYWSLFAKLAPAGDADAGEGANAFITELTHVGGERLGKMTPGSKAEAEEAATAIVSAGWGPDSALVVHDVTEKEVQRRPKPPFTTSTMQQEASSRLGFGAARTMSAAQALYEGRGWGEGLITYMRTDGLHVSPAAVAEMRHVAASAFGSAYVPATPNHFKKVQKNAQEAHEAIRPTFATVLPSAVAARLGAETDEARLYRLVWARAMASQMAPAVTKRILVDVRSDEARGGIRLKANGSRLLFPGFLAAFDANDGSSSLSGSDKWLPQLAPGERVCLCSDEVSFVEREKGTKRGGFGAATANEGASGATSETQGVSAHQHWTQPPARYTEGSLVKALEELGIGRPSTYATIMRVITKRGYVSGTGGRGPLVPEMRGRLVSSFLSHFFDEYVDYGFTAGLEDRLDDIANGKEEWKGVLSNFWGPFAGEVDTLKGLRTSLVVDVLDAILGVHFFGDDNETLEARLKDIEAAYAVAAEEVSKDLPYPKLAFDPDALSALRKCPSCEGGRLGLKLSRTGGFIGCSNYPECSHTRQLIALSEPSDDAAMTSFPKTLGRDPESGRKVVMLNGPYGPYVQMEPRELSLEAKAAAKGAEKAAFAEALAAAEYANAVATEEAYAQITAEDIVEGKKPPIHAVVKPPKKKNKAKDKQPKGEKPKTFGLVNAGIKPEDVTLELALQLLQYPMVLGHHPDDGKAVSMQMGPFGWYVSHDGLNASLPKKLLRSIRDDAVASAIGVTLADNDVPMDGDLAMAVAQEDFPYAEGEGENNGEGESRDARRGENEGDAEAELSPEVRAAVLRAQYAPVPLDVAVDLLTKKRLKPPSNRGWGRRTKKGEAEGTSMGDGDKDVKGVKNGSTASPKIEEKKPKRPPSAFMLYCGEARGALPEGLNVPEQAKMLGAQWRSLGAEEKERFGKLAAEAKAAAAAASGAKGRDGKAAKPKRPPSAFMLYCGEARGALPEGLKVPEQAKMLGAQWRSLGVEEKGRFEALAAEAKAAAAEARGKDRPKRPPTAYMLYCSETRGSLPLGLKMTEQTKELGARWRSLGAEERAKFDAMASEAKKAAAAEAAAGAAT